MALMKYIWHSSNSLSTTKYLAMCSGRAKVKLGGFVGSHYCTFRTSKSSPKQEKYANFSTYAYIINLVPLVF